MEQETQSTPTTISHARSPISIALLFYVVTLAAIVSACLRTLVGSETVTSQAIVRLVFAGISLGLLGGGLVGFFYLKGLKATLWGTLVGTLLGAVAGALALVHNDRFAEISLVAFAGCWLMIIVMLISARFQSGPQV